MTPSLILFDVDGTLIDAAGAGRRALETAFRRLHGADGVGRASSRVRFEGKTDPIIIAEIAREIGLPGEAIERSREEFRKIYLEALDVELSRPDPRRRVLSGVRPLLDELARRPAVHIGLITGNIEDGARAKLRALDLERYFETGGFASDHADRAEIARLAREKVGHATGISFSAERVTVIGDTDHDVACARANGFRAIAVHSGYVSRERLLACRPDAVFEDFTDLEGVLAALFGDRFI